jgi:hypothetical protein
MELLVEAALVSEDRLSTLTEANELVAILYFLGKTVQ